MVKWALLAATVLLGAVMRFYLLGSLPPGLYHDEAMNGLDALGILEGERPLFFEANNGREPLFLYAMALALSVWGRTPFAVRVMAALFGTLTIPATFLMARALFGERIGLWSAWLIAVAPWPISLSRIGLRAVSMPFIVALGVWLWWSGGARRGRARVAWLASAGVVLGLSLYTYTAARFVPVAVALFVLYQIWATHERPNRRDVMVVALAALLAMMPLIVYGATHWETFAERAAQVSILNPAINHGDPWGMLVRNVFRAAGLFFFRGDRIPRHNVPLRPLFDPLIAVFFVMGVLLSLAKLRSGRGRYALILIWVGVMLIPTVMAEDCPHFLRAVGVLPMAAVLPALGLEWSAGRIRAAGLRWAGELLIGAALVVSGIWGGYDYFVRYGRDTNLGYWFEAAEVQAAIEANRFLGTGWQGQGIREPPGVPIPDRYLYLGPRIWEDRFAINFLLGSPERMSILGRDAPVEVDTVLALAWPYGETSGVAEVFPHPAQIESWAGPLERGDLDAVPSMLYAAFRAERLEGQLVPIARFDGGIDLLGWKASSQSDGRTRVRLRWQVAHPLDTDYNVFVHLVYDGQVVAQSDGSPAGGVFPTSWWRPGDEIVDDHVLDAFYDAQREQLVVGWYEWSSMRHLRVLGENGQPGEEELTVR